MGSFYAAELRITRVQVDGRGPVRARAGSELTEIDPGELTSWPETGDIYR